MENCLFSLDTQETNYCQVPFDCAPMDSYYLGEFSNIICDWTYGCNVHKYLFGDPGYRCPSQIDFTVF